MKSKRIIAVITVSLAGLAFFNAGCHRGESSPPGAHMPPPDVTVAPVEQREIVQWEELTGRTASIEYVEVRPRVSGHIEKIHFESGQMVKKGDVLFVIDSRWYKADAERREAELAMTQSRSDNAEREAKRNPQLLASKALSKEEAEARDARYLEARAALLAAKAARDSAQLDLEHTSIRAPIDGRVSRALVTVGNYISGVAGAATLLTTIVSVDPVYVYADLHQPALLRFNSLSRSGQLATNGTGQVPVELQLGDESGFPHHGHIESLDNRVDPQSGSIVLRAVLPNPDGRIVPGLFARIRVPSSGLTPVVLVDETAIGTDQAQKYVLSVSTTNTTLYRPVKLGPSIDGKRIVREGLAAGDLVIVNGLARVRPGMPVHPVEATSTNRDTRVAKN